MPTTTLNLGVLEFAADADPDGKSMRVVIRGAIDTDVHFMTVAEWQSLCDLAAERRHLEGHTWALQAQLDDVAEALGKDRLEASDGYHGTAVRELCSQLAAMTAARDALAAMCRDHVSRFDAERQQRIKQLSEVGQPRESGEE